MNETTTVFNTTQSMDTEDKAISADNPMLGLLLKSGKWVFGAEIAVGLILLGLGTAFLMLSRRLVKIIYFFSALFFFGLVSFTIGVAVVAIQIGEATGGNIPKSNLEAVLGCSFAVGLIFAVLAVYFGKLGLVIVGLTSGYSLWNAIGQFIPNEKINLICSIVFAILAACLCVKYKRPMEIVATAIVGAKLFAFGFYLLFDGASAMKNIKMDSNSDKKEVDSYLKLTRINLVVSLVLQILFTVTSGYYHLNVYKREGMKLKNNQSEDILLRRTPIYKPIR